MENNRKLKTLITTLCQGGVTEIFWLEAFTNNYERPPTVSERFLTKDS